MARHYQPCWCEENIWHLAGADESGAGERLVLIFSGASGHVACWNQRAAAPGEVALWDYHVVLAVRGPDGARIWDLDTRIGCPLDARAWAAGTFPTRVDSGFTPRFLVLTAAEYRRDLYSDRGHMRQADGSWQQPPPPWPALVGGTVTLSAYRLRAQAGATLDRIMGRLTRD